MKILNSIAYLMLSVAIIVSNNSYTSDNSTKDSYTQLLNKKTKRAQNHDLKQDKYENNKKRKINNSDTDSYNEFSIFKPDNYLSDNQENYNENPNEYENFMDMDDDEQDNDFRLLRDEQ